MDILIKFIYNYWRKIVKGGALRSGEDIAQDGAFAYRRKNRMGNTVIRSFIKDSLL